MAVKLAATDFLQLADGNVFSLVIRIEQPTGGIEVHAVWTAEAKCPGGEGTVAADLGTATAIGNLGALLAEGQIERDEQVPTVAHRAIGELVIVSETPKRSHIDSYSSATSSPSVSRNNDNSGRCMAHRA